MATMNQSANSPNLAETGSSPTQQMPRLQSQGRIVRNEEQNVASTSSSPKRLPRLQSTLGSSSRLGKPLAFEKSLEDSANFSKNHTEPSPRLLPRTQSTLSQSSRGAFVRGNAALYSMSPRGKDDSLHPSPSLSRHQSFNLAASRSLHRPMSEADIFSARIEAAFVRHSVQEGEETKVLPQSQIKNALYALDLNPVNSRIEATLRKNGFNDRHLILSEFVRLVNAFRTTTTSLNAMIKHFKVLDTDDDLQISRDQFVEFNNGLPVSDRVTGKALVDVITRMDPANSGMITMFAFLKTLFSEISEDEILAAMRAMGYEHDYEGRIKAEREAALMKAQREERDIVAFDETSTRNAIVTEEADRYLHFGPLHTSSFKAAKDAEATRLAAEEAERLRRLSENDMERLRREAEEDERRRREEQEASERRRKEEEEAERRRREGESTDEADRMRQEEERRRAEEERLANESFATALIEARRSQENAESYDRNIVTTTEDEERRSMVKSMKETLRSEREEERRQRKLRRKDGLCCVSM